VRRINAENGHRPGPIPATDGQIPCADALGQTKRDPGIFLAYPVEGVTDPFSLPERFE